MSIRRSQKEILLNAGKGAEPSRGRSCALVGRSVGDRIVRSVQHVVQLRSLLFMERQRVQPVVLLPHGLSNELGS